MEKFDNIGLRCVPQDCVSLVSTYVVSLSVIQRQARLPEFFDQIAKNALFLTGQEYPPSPEIEI